MTDADMIEAMKIAIGPHFIGNRMPDMSGDPLRKATPYERRRIDEAVTAALAVVQPELDRLRAEVEELTRERDRAVRRESTSHRFWMRAAKSALAGDARELHNRVELAEAPPVAVVLSNEDRARAALSAPAHDGEGR